MPCKKHFGFLATAILAALMVTLAVALPGVSADGDEDKNREMDQGEEQAFSIPEKAELKYPNLGSHLDGLVVQVEDGETTSQGAALDTPVHSGASVAVTIHLTGNVDDVVTFLEENGGDPRNVGEDYIEAYVPVSLLGQLSEQPGVIRVREIVPPQPAQLTQRITGHGPPVHGSQAWNQAGYSGQGVKVGIIDTGFTGFSSLMETELPTTVVARCYTDVGVFTQDLADCEAAPNVTDVRPPQCLDYVRRSAASGDSHGTIVAESLIDIAPGVELYIANPYSPGDLQATAAWMASQGVSVINHSVGWFFDGPGDGTSPISASALNTVDRAVASDVTWVNAASNSADDTWFGGYSDPDGDRALRFGGQNNEIMGIFVGACRLYSVQLRWEDNWDGASTDLNLHLADRRTGETLLYSVATQSGESGHVPLEWIRFRSAIETRDLGIAVTHYSGEAPDWVQITVWGPGGIQHHTKNGSIGNPAESANLGMLAVGAAHWNDVRAIEPYSSRGPTPDERDKPDIVGADCGATALSPLNEYNSGFCGTSQASPHVAGMAALVRQRFPSYTPAQVASYLKDNAEQRQSPDPNSTWGHGFAKLPPPDGAPPTAPAPSNAFTRNPAVDFNTLAGAGNEWSTGIWSDGETMWVADWLNGKIYAYDMATKERVSGKDFDTLDAAENTRPGGIWSDGETMWVADWLDGKIYAYDMATKERVSGKDFDTLDAAENTRLGGIWSDGETMWVVDWLDGKIYAYDMATKERVSGKDFNSLKAARNVSPEGIWSDGKTMWVADSQNDKVYAYDMATGARVPGREFNTLDAAGNWIPIGIWSDAETMLVADLEDDKIYAYYMPQVESAADREALVALYNATGGANWTNNTNWLTNAPIGQWHGVTTDANGRVTKLYLQENVLSGQIPTELGSLSNLENLVLWGNELTGTIPTKLGSLANLELLSVSDNQLTGTIPTELGSLANLEELYLWGNELTGTIPAELGSLANLKELSLTRNQLAGEIPPELGSLTNLEILALGGNQLTGEIPSELGSLANLEELYLWGNELTGTIPAELGSLANLEELYLWGNELTGTIPAELGSLANLVQLELAENQLTGEIPTELGSLANLEELYLTRNHLSGEIPAELGSLTSLEILALGGNQLSGTIPTWLGSLSNLEELYLWGNELTGTIPTELGSLVKLKGLRLSENQLTGQIPTELGSLSNLENLVLWGNELTGEIPQTLVGLIMLESFSFYNNLGLCAPVDDAFQTWLRGISIVYGSSCAPADSPEDRAVLVQAHSATDGANWTNNTNWLSDEHSIREWYGVTIDANGRVNGLFLGDNQLTGDIPAELGSLTELEWMFLNQNQLTGEIPAELGNLTNLARLRLDGNRLTGTIPAELGRLTNLTVLYLSGNPLTGCVPASLRDVEDTDFAQLGLTFCTSGIDVGIAEDLSIAGDAAVSDYAEDQADTTVATYTVSGDNVATAMWSLPTGDPDGDGPLVAAQTRDKDFFKLEGTGQERVLKFKAAPNFEMPRGQAVSATNTNVYMVTLQARHDDEDIAFRPVTITVTDVDELGMLSGDDSFSYAEGGTDAVGTYTLTAIEDGPTVTWSLDGTDKSDFMLEGTGMSRMLKFSSAPDYEAPADADSDNTYMVTVKASAGGEMKMVDVTVMVTDVDELGELTPDMDSPISHPENSMDTVATYTVTGTMADMATWTLEGDDAESFMLDGTGMSRMLKFSSAPDYEAPADADSDNTYMVTVKASAGGEMKMVDVTVMVTDVDELGELTPDMDSPISHPENSMDTVATYTVTGTMADMATWTLEGDDAESFMLDGTGMSRMLKFSSAPDYEAPADADSDNTYMVTVKASAGGEMKMVDVTVMVTDVDELGELTPDMDSPISHPENSMDTVATYTVTGTMADMATWTLEGDDAESFMLDGTGMSRMLKFSSAPDYEAPADADSDNTYMVTVKASAGGEMKMVDVTVMVTDVDELGELTPDMDSPISHPENSMDTVATYTVTGTMADMATWTLEGDDAESFMLDGTGMSRMLKFSSAPDYEAPADADSDNTYMVTVKASAGGEMKMVDVTVNITDVDENVAPAFPSETATRSIAENTAANTNIGDPVAATDPNGDTLTYSLEGTDAASFGIDGSTGQLSTLAALDFETKTAYTVVVKATDPGGLSDTIDVTINVTDVIEEVPVDLVDGYDTNGVAGIQIDELFSAIDDYFAGEINISELFEVIDAYFG